MVGAIWGDAISYDGATINGNPRCGIKRPAREVKPVFRDKNIMQVLHPKDLIPEECSVARTYHHGAVPVRGECVATDAARQEAEAGHSTV